MGYFFTRWARAGFWQCDRVPMQLYRGQTYAESERAVLIACPVKNPAYPSVRVG